MSRKHDDADAGRRPQNQRPRLVPAAPQRHRDDGSPMAGEGQVYVTRSGRQYHTQWCPSIEGRWRISPNRVFVSALADIDDRTVCRQCEYDPDAGSPQRPLIKVETTTHRVDGSPIAGEGQVYVTRTGKLYHPAWCSVMAAHWRDNPGRAFVSALADVGARTSCPNCEEAGQQSTSGRAELRRLNGELNRLGRDIARILVAKGPEGLNQLGPHVIRFRETETELNNLSLRITGRIPDPEDAADL